MGPMSKKLVAGMLGVVFFSFKVASLRVFSWRELMREQERNSVSA